jgi:hypothetical protein
MRIGANANGHTASVAPCRQRRRRPGFRREVARHRLVGRASVSAGAMTRVLGTRTKRLLTRDRLPARSCIGGRAAARPLTPPSVQRGSGPGARDIRSAPRLGANWVPELRRKRRNRRQTPAQRRRRCGRYAGIKRVRPARRAGAFQRATSAAVSSSTSLLTQVLPRATWQRRSRSIGIRWPRG